MTVYFIGEVGTNFVKIGKTDRNVRKRLGQLQTASPRPLELLATTDAESERHFHTRFEAKRIRGEWYGISKVELAKIGELDYTQPMMATKTCVDLAALMRSCQKKYPKNGEYRFI